MRKFLRSIRNFWRKKQEALDYEMESVNVCEYCLNATSDFLSWVMAYHPTLVQFPLMPGPFYALCGVICREDWAELLSGNHPLFLAYLEYSVENENYEDAADLRDCLAIHNLTLKEPLPSTLKEALKSR